MFGLRLSLDVEVQHHELKRYHANTLIFTAAEFQVCTTMTRRNGLVDRHRGTVRILIC